MRIRSWGFDMIPCFVQEGVTSQHCHFARYQVFYLQSPYLHIECYSLHSQLAAALCRLLARHGQTRLSTLN